MTLAPVNSTPYNPYMTSTSTAQPPMPTSSPQAFSADRFQIFSTNSSGRVSGDSDLTKSIVGGIAGYKYHPNFLGGESGAIQSALGASIGIGSLISGSLSILKNVNALTHGQQSAGQSIGNIITDTVQGAVSGIGGVTVGGLSAMALKGMGLVSKTPLAIVGVIGGAVGAVMLNKILNTEGLRKVLAGG